ncbi:hypothetical protein RRG08_065308, partial [Elysia crispata]
STAQQHNARAWLNNIMLEHGSNNTYARAWLYNIMLQHNARALLYNLCQSMALQHTPEHGSTT